MTSVLGESNDKAIPAVLGEHTGSGDAIRGNSPSGTGVLGTSTSGVAVWGGSQTSSGVGGMSTSGVGVHGVSTAGPGVRGDSPQGTGVLGVSSNAIGVHGMSDTNEGIRAETKSPTVAALAAIHLNPEGTGAALYAQKDGSLGHAGFFIGHVQITRNLIVEGDISLQNADCAEEFEVAEAVDVDPGSVLVMGNDGRLEICSTAYDRRVAGVVSGAGSFKPGIVLDQREGSKNRRQIALLGKVYCKVDASYGQVRVGDLITTSDTPGFAMRASDPARAFGSVLGKALRPLSEGRNLVPILVALQ